MKLIIRDITECVDVWSSQHTDDVLTVITNSRELRTGRSNKNYLIIMETDAGARGLYHGPWS